MRHLDLFSGICGFALAARWTGSIETVGFCEIEEACRGVISHHWPDTPIINDIRKLKGDEFGKVDIITGGYPCQPYSVAGNQEAEEDDRYLWPEMRRIIAQVRPTWAICENVYGHIKLGLDQVLHDLEAEGYTARPFIIPALCTGGNHNRNRVFIVAYSPSNGCNGSQTTGSNGEANERSKKGSNQNSHNEGCGSLWSGVERASSSPGTRRAEPPALRVANELPNRMDRNRMLGNAIDPGIAYQLFKTILAL